MKTVSVIRYCFVAFILCIYANPALAIEGSSAAGPIAGTDMRSAQMPPPGLYSAVTYAFIDANNFYDGNGNRIRALNDFEVEHNILGGALLYVPDMKLLGGSLGFLGVASAGEECGRVFSITPIRCQTGARDPYVEAAWSRYFGTARPSVYSGAYPILEGLSVQLGIGTVIPIGRYDKDQVALNAISNGDNIWDVAPSLAMTYVTRPIIAEGTEFSAKLYWNNYWENPDTHYQTGDFLSLDFAITERIGKIQLGLAGFYGVQIEDDELFGQRVLPDGRLTEILTLGFVGVYDMPAQGTSFHVKGLWSTLSENTVDSFGISFSVYQKLY